MLIIIRLSSYSAATKYNILSKVITNISLTSASSCIVYLQRVLQDYVFALANDLLVEDSRAGVESRELPVLLVIRKRNSS